jgi:hypothetical protein
MSYVFPALVGVAITAGLVSMVLRSYTRSQQELAVLSKLPAEEARSYLEQIEKRRTKSRRRFLGLAIGIPLLFAALAVAMLLMPA